MSVDKSVENEEDPPRCSPSSNIPIRVNVIEPASLKLFARWYAYQMASH